MSESKRLFVLNQDLSGINQPMMQALRHKGWDVRTQDVRYTGGWRRYLFAARTFHLQRREWQYNYHQMLGNYSRSVSGLQSKTSMCSRILRRHAQPDDVILSFTHFSPTDLEWQGPYVAFKDYTVALARRTYPEIIADRTDEGVDRRIELEATFCNHAALVLTASENTRQSVVSDYEVAPERVISVGEGVGIDPLPFRPGRQPSKNGGGELLFVGKEFRRKGGEVLLAAFSRIRQHFPSARLTIAGPEPPSTIPPGVNWVGLVKDRSILCDLFRNASLFIMPSLCEPFGLVFLEAMAFGLPCIGTMRDAMPEIIDDGVTGYVVPVEDSETLAERILHLLGDPDLMHQMGVAGFDRLVSRYTWSHVGARIDDALTTLLNQDPSGR